jgi:hypothetical protein
MDRTLKVLVIILVVLVALGGFFTYTVYSSVRSAGVITVNVHPKDARPSFTVPVPAAFINAFADAATVHGIECDGELEAWRPAINAAMEEFDRYPDMTFLEIDDYDDHVEVRKAGGKMIIDVDADEAVVQVSIPPRTVRKFVNAMTSVHIDRDDDWDVEVMVDDERLDI